MNLKGIYQQTWLVSLNINAFQGKYLYIRFIQNKTIRQLAVKNNKDLTA